MLKISLYQPKNKDAWDSFVVTAKNGTFLHQRDFMDYHAHKFEDFSLIIRSEKEQVLAILPANRVENQIYSHAGLTYGGLLLQKGEKLANIILYWQQLLTFLAENGIETLFYKTVPLHYHRELSLEEQYIFSLLQAQIYRTDTSFVIDNQQFSEFNHRRQRSIKKALKQQPTIAEGDFGLYWEEILTPNLQARFGVNPVHSLEEILLLKSRFPTSIFQYNLFLDQQIAAGVTIFKTNTTAHAQYISTNELGKATGAVDYLFDFLIKTAFKDTRYFSFGIANEAQGKKMNWGLAEWKESFSPQIFPQHFYQIDTQKANLLTTVLNV